MRTAHAWLALAAVASCDPAGEADASVPAADGDTSWGDGDPGADGSDDAGRADTDAAVPEIRDDALVPPLHWIEQARRVMDHDTLGAAFAAEGWAPPDGSEIYAARVVAGVGGPAYELYDAGGGAFSTDFWPASTVKVLSSLAALELLAELGFTGAAHVTWDSGFGDVARDIVDRAIRLSSNEDYDRTIRLAGFDRLNASFLDDTHGFPGVVIQRSYARFPIRDIPGMTIEEDGATEYVPQRVSTTDYGCGDDGNCASLFELGEAVRRVMLDAEITEPERFAIAPADVGAVQDALCGAIPSFFAAGAERALGHAAAICHKPGWVPWNDCLDHGLVTDPATGARWILAVSVPETEGRVDCMPLADVADHTLRALAGAPPGLGLAPDAGVPIRVQVDDLGPDGAGRGHRFTVDAASADHVALFADREPVGAADADGRFVVEHAFVDGGERLLVVHASRAGALVGIRALRVAITPPAP